MMRKRQKLHLMRFLLGISSHKTTQWIAQVHLLLPDLYFLLYAYEKYLIRRFRRRATVRLRVQTQKSVTRKKDEKPAVTPKTPES